MNARRHGTRNRIARRRWPAVRAEQGFVSVFAAVLIPVLLVFVAYTVDYGSFYVRSAQLKRAADAAALAGVVWMPEFDEAQQYALAAAARNGFVDGQNNISVSVQQVANNDRQLTVTITDAKAKRFFSSNVFGNQSLSATSTAEYELPVPLGSPKNTIGTGNLLSSPDTENFWLAVNGYCAGHESGDPKLVGWESYSTSSSSSACNNGSAANSDDYDANGYLYQIDLPQNSSSLKLDVYDGGFNTSGSTPDYSLAGTPVVTTTYKIYDRNPTPLDLTNLTLLKTVTITTNNSTYQNKWVNLYTWTNPQAGPYYVRVTTDPTQTTNSRGSNGFGLRAYTGSTFSTCTTVSGSSNYSSACPQVHGVFAMSLFADLSGTTSDFYLAQIASTSAGKTMRVSLFDIGEGAVSVQVLDPNGNPATFSWTTPCNPPTPPTGSCSGSNVTSLSVSGSGTQPYTGLNSSSLYSDRYLTLDILLPANYATVYGTKQWWKIRYTVGSSPTDRTTWSANIVGDPVHLVG